MNLIFEANYAVFSIFAALLITEVMGSVVLLLFYDAAKSKVLEYVVPIWEVTGTFAAFWVVTGDMAYPTLLVPLAAIFGALLTVFLILLVGRNVTIVFGEFVIKRKWLDAKKLYKAYALATVFLGVAALILISALVSGAGVLSNASPLSAAFDLGSWASNAGSPLFLAGTLLIGVGLAPVFFDIRPLAGRFFAATLLGVVCSVGGYYEYSSSLVTAYIAVPTALTVAANLLYFSKRTAPIVVNKAAFVAVLSVVVFSLQGLVYPKVVGQALSVDALTTTGPMVPVFYAVTAVGGGLLAAMIAIYVFVAMRHDRLAGSTATKYPSTSLAAQAAREPEAPGQTWPHPDQGKHSAAN